MPGLVIEKAVEKAGVMVAVLSSVAVRPLGVVFAAGVDEES